MFNSRWEEMAKREKLEDGKEFGDPCRTEPRRKQGGGPHS